MCAAVLLAAALLGLVTLAWAGGDGESLEKAPAASVRQVPNFYLPDAEGTLRALSDYRDKRFVVVTFLGTQCPIGNKYLPILMDLQDRYADQGVQVLAINAHPGDTAEAIAAHALEYKLTLPVLIDAEQRVMAAFGATRMAETFVLDDRGRVRYRGRIDDRFGYRTDRAEPTRHDLEEALKELLAGGEVSVPVTETAGCLLTALDAPPPPAPVTYSEQVSRIIQEKCQKCHHPGTAAPFSLLTYDDAVNWSAMIKEVVHDRRMPPWHADPRHGSFSNDRRLAQSEIDALLAWVDGGTPLGDESRLPPPREYADGWTIGKPDVIFEMPETVTVPASGVVPYQYYTTETKFDEDVWISAAEARPGNRAVVHHIIVFYRGPEEDSGRLGQNWIAATAPGDMPLVLPPGVGRKIPAGSTLVWQMHYTPTGKEETDRSQVGLVFYKGDQPPDREAETHGIADHRFRIPPGEAHHQVESNMTIPRDAYLLSFMPHMHLRGKDFEYRATFPDGRSEVLLSVPRYDFNWQSTYRLAEPLLLPRGTRIDCVAHFDNSSGNPANPDPAETVRWGDQTWEEMMIGYIDYYWAE